VFESYRKQPVVGRGVYQLRPRGRNGAVRGVAIFPLSFSASVPVNSKLEMRD